MCGCRLEKLIRRRCGLNKQLDLPSWKQRAYEKEKDSLSSFLPAGTRLRRVHLQNGKLRHKSNPTGSLTVVTTSPDPERESGDSSFENRRGAVRKRGRGPIHRKRHCDNCGNLRGKIGGTNRRISFIG